MLDDSQLANSEICRNVQGLVSKDTLVQENITHSKGKMFHILLSRIISMTFHV